MLDVVRFNSDDFMAAGNLGQATFNMSGAAFGKGIKDSGYAADCSHIYEVNLGNCAGEVSNIGSKVDKGAFPASGMFGITTASVLRTRTRSETDITTTPTSPLTVGFPQHFRQQPIGIKTEKGAKHLRTWNRLLQAAPGWPL